VGVGIDESGCEHETVGVDLEGGLVRRPPSRSRDVNDSAVRQDDVRGVLGCPGPVDQACAADQHRRGRDPVRAAPGGRPSFLHVAPILVLNGPSQGLVYLCRRAGARRHPVKPCA